MRSEIGKGKSHFAPRSAPHTPPKFPSLRDRRKISGEYLPGLMLVLVVILIAQVETTLNSADSFPSPDRSKSRESCKRSQHFHGFCDSRQPSQQRLCSGHQSANLSTRKTAGDQILHGTVPLPLLHHPQRHQRFTTDPE